MIAANEAVATLLSERSIPTLYRVHERPEPRSALRLVEQLASLDVATPPVPDPMAPSQAADDRRAVRGAGRSARAPHRPRPPGAHDARAALAQAGALLAGEPRPRRPAVDALLPLHLAHPPLPRPRLPPGAAQRRGRRRGRAARRHARRGGRVDVGARARRDGHRARRRRRRPLLPARARHVRRRLGHASTTARSPASSARAPSSTFGAGYQGMLPVRRLRGDWWELNEQGTMLIGERNDGVIRLGDP